MQAEGSGRLLVQRAIVSQVLRNDHPHGWTRAELGREIGTEVVRDGLIPLAGDGVVIVDGERVEASRCTRHLDALNLIAI